MRVEVGVKFLSLIFLRLSNHTRWARPCSFINWLWEQFFTLSNVFSRSWLSFQDLDCQVGHWGVFGQGWGPSLLYPPLSPARNINQIPQICPVSLILPARVEKIMKTSHHHSVPFSCSLEYSVLFVEDYPVHLQLKHSTPAKNSAT